MAATPTVPTTLAPMTTVALAPLQSKGSVNPAVIVVGIIALLALFVASFYYVVIWPKRALAAYRNLIKHQLEHEEIPSEISEARKLVESGNSGQRMAGRRVPTMAELVSVRERNQNAGSSSMLQQPILERSNSEL